MRFPLEPTLERAILAFYAEFFIRIVRAKKNAISEERAIDVIQRANTLQEILDSLRIEAATVAPIDRENERSGKPVEHVEKAPLIKTPISFFRDPIAWAKRWLSTRRHSI